MADSLNAVTTIVVLYILVAVIVSLRLRGCFFEEESFSSAIRNLIVIWGAPLATFLAVWRSSVAQKQAEVAQLGLLSARYQRAVEMLGRAGDAIRIGGIHALLNLAREYPEEYLEEVHVLLDAYNVNSGGSMSRNEREALQHALLIIKRLVDNRILLGPANRWWRRLLFWLKNLYKRS